jgi:hypothetical protein
MPSVRTTICGPLCVHPLTTDDNSVVRRLLLCNEWTPKAYPVARIAGEIMAVLRIAVARDAFEVILITYPSTFARVIDGWFTVIART